MNYNLAHAFFENSLRNPVTHHRQDRSQFSTLPV
jgi:hypothetical protein